MEIRAHILQNSEGLYFESFCACHNRVQYSHDTFVNNQSMVTIS